MNQEIYGPNKNGTIKNFNKNNYLTINLLVVKYLGGLIFFVIQNLPKFGEHNMYWRMTLKFFERFR